VLSLLLLVLEFAVIHDSANWRFLGRGDLYQIEPGFTGLLKCLVRADDSQLCSVMPNHADGRDTDLLIDPLSFAVDRLGLLSG
jgi:hypothetical protein